MRIAVILLGALLAGCLGGPAGSPAPAAAALPLVELHGCSNLGADFPLPMGAARALLPPGFEPIARDTAPSETAVFYVIGVACRSAEVDGKDVGEARLAYEEIDVTPPAAAKLAGIDDAVVPIAFTAQPAALADALVALHLGLAGRGAIELAASTPADASLTVTRPDASFTLQAALGAPADALGASRFAVYGVQDKAVKTVLVGSTTEAASVVTGALTLRSAGDPTLAQARPAATGFRVSTFDLALRPA